MLTGNLTVGNQNITTVNTGRKRYSEGSIIEFLRFILAGIFKLHQIHKKYHPEIVVAFFTIPGGILSLVNKLLFKTPYIVSVRGGDIPGFQLGNKYAKMQNRAKPFVKMVSHHAEKVHVNSRRLYDLALQNHVRDEKLIMIPNGINIQNAEFRDNIPANKIKMLFSGRLSQQKNLAVFIRALSKIKKDFLFTIIGEGSEEQYLKNIVKALGMTEKIIFEKWKKREELRQIYKDFNIFVLPSLDEGMSNSALEAVENQCALLSSANAHLQWNDEDIMAHWVVREYTSEVAWQNTLEYIFDNSQSINDTSKKMKQFIIDNNDWEILFDQYEKMLEQCVE